MVDKRFITKAFRVFMPFTPGLWLLLLAVTVMMSLTEVWIFRDEWRKDGLDDWIEAQGLFAKLKVLVFHWGRYLGRSLIHLCSGLPDAGSTPAQTCLWVGWAFFILIAVSAYTANLHVCVCIISNELSKTCTQCAVDVRPKQRYHMKTHIHRCVLCIP